MSITGFSAIATGLIAGGSILLSPVLVDRAPQDDGVLVPKVSSDQRGSEAVSMVHMAADDVRGEFAWNQGVVCSNEYLRRNLYKASAALCESRPSGFDAAKVMSVVSEGDISTIEVRGDVANAFTLNVERYGEDSSVTKVLGCTCAGNAVDGRASANAEVTGIPLADIIADVQAQDAVNTITFVSRDGYEVSLPLSYVMQRFSVLVTEVNGETMYDAFGSYNQIWLGSTSARLYARDVVEIVLTIEDEVPGIPHSLQQAAPGVGITEGGVM